MKTAVVAATLAVFLAGCAAPRQAMVVEAPFNEAEAAEMMKPGKNTITGSALLRQQGGGVVTCAGSPVLLIPATAYAKERLAKTFGGSSVYRGAPPSFAPTPAAYGTHLRKGTCNAQGFFRFEEVADGEFFIVTQVLWTAGRYQLQQGGSVYGRTTVSGGKTVEVTITQ